jgi:hypothetical protein
MPNLLMIQEIWQQELGVTTIQFVDSTYGYIRKSDLLSLIPVDFLLQRQ